MKTDEMSEFEWRSQKLKSHMNKEGLEALLIYSHPMITDMWRHTVTDIVFWISNYDIISGWALVVLPMDGNPALFVSESWDFERALKKSWIKDVRVSKEIWKESYEAVKELGLLNSKIGLSGKEFMSAYLYGGFSEAFSGKQFEFCSELARNALFPKSEEEMEPYRKGAEISEVGFRAILEILRPGVTDLDLHAEAQYVMRKMGAEDMATLIGSGPHPTAMTSPTGRTIKEGDMLVLEPNPLYKGIFIEICRTVVVGKISPVRREKFDILINAYEKSAGLVKPEVSCSELAMAMEDVIAASGYAEYLRPPFSRVRGHGDIGGLQVTDENPTKLVPGMVLTLHPNNYFPETGYMALGEPLLVTENGCERLTEMPIKLYATEREVRE